MYTNTKVWCLLQLGDEGSHVTEGDDGGDGIIGSSKTGRESWGYQRVEHLLVGGVGGTEDDLACSYLHLF